MMSVQSLMLEGCFHISELTLNLILRQVGSGITTNHGVMYNLQSDVETWNLHTGALDWSGVGGERDWV